MEVDIKLDRMTSQVATLQARARELCRDELWDSAALLGSFMLSASGRAVSEGRLPASGPGSHLESMVIFATILKGKGETRRAIKYFEQALQ